MPVVAQKTDGTTPPSAAARASTTSVPTVVASILIISHRKLNSQRFWRFVHRELSVSTDTLVDSPALIVRSGRKRKSWTAAVDPVGTHWIFLSLPPRNDTI